MTQPLYRYESTDPKVEGRGRCSARDRQLIPGVILQLEAHQGDGKGKSVWNYGLSPQRLPLRVRHAETIVWSVPWGGDGKDSVYYEK